MCCVLTDQFSPPQRQISKPFRMCVSDVSKSMGLGQTVSGRVYAGAAAVGNSVRTFYGFTFLVASRWDD